MTAATHYACDEKHKHRPGCPVRGVHTKGSSATTARCKECARKRRLWVQGRYRAADEYVDVPCPQCGKARRLSVQVAKGYESRSVPLCWACRASRGPAQAMHVTGYVLLKVDPDDPLLAPMIRRRRNGRHVSSYLPEHRVVMARILGRPLERWEEVHHRNGRRTDNRRENLELWVRAQPPGQRVEDLVTWARWIIATYA